MQFIFEQGKFPPPSNSFSPIQGNTLKDIVDNQKGKRARVFLSHRHSDIEDPIAREAVRFLASSEFDLFIDSIEPLPLHTSGETAKMIMAAIERNPRFIAIVTDNYFSSNWCNWELGLATGMKKFDEDVALLFLSDRCRMFEQAEFMKNYPVIVYFDGDDTYSTGETIPRGYYFYNPLSGNIREFDSWVVDVALEILPDDD